MTIRCLVIAMVIVAGTVVGELAAFADGCPSGTGSLTQDALGAGVCVPGATSTGGQGGGITNGNSGIVLTSGSSTGSSSGAGTSSGQNPYKWSREWLDDYSVPVNEQGVRLPGSPDPNCTGQYCTQYDYGGIMYAPSCTGPNGVAGRPYRDTLTDTRTGDVVSSAEGCYVAGISNPAAGGSSGAPPPPPPPLPPTAAEVIQASNLPRLQFGLSPAGRNCAPSGSVGSTGAAPPCGVGEAPGLTGLETLLWVNPAPPAEVSVTVNIRGYTVTSRAHPVRYSWQMSRDGDTTSTRNPDPAIVTVGPGSAEAPAARYRWETKGDYRVSLAVVWQGSYTFSGFGVTSRTESLGPVTGQPAVVPYHVVEVRSVPGAPLS